MNTLKDQILDHLDLKEMAEEQGAIFKNNRSHCPIHKGNNKSAFQLSESGKRWTCWTDCGQSGNAIDFYMEIHNLDFRTALNELADKTGVMQKQNTALFKPITRPSEQYLTRMENLVKWGEKHLDIYAYGYLDLKRRLEDETMIKFRLGYNPRCLWRDGWREDGKAYISKGIIIPHLNEEGQPFWANIRRPLPHSDLAEYVGAVTNYPKVKYWGTPGKYRRLAGRHTHQMRDTLLIVEGEFDMMTVWQEANDMVDVATFGGASNVNLCVSDATYLMRYKRILGCFDPDNAGQNGLAKLIKRLGRLEVIAPPGNGDLNEFHVAGGSLRKWVEAAII